MNTLTERQEQILCELNPDDCLVCTGTEAEVSELEDLGLIDTQTEFLGLTPAGEIVFRYIERARSRGHFNRET